MPKFSLTITKTFAKHIKQTDIVWNGDDKELASFDDELAAGHLFEKFTGRSAWSYGRTIQILNLTDLTDEVSFWIKDKTGSAIAHGSFTRDGSLFYSANSLRTNGYATVYRDGKVLGTIQRNRLNELCVYNKQGDRLEHQEQKREFEVNQRWLERLFPFIKDESPVESPVEVIELEGFNMVALETPIEGQGEALEQFPIDDTTQEEKPTVEPVVMSGNTIVYVNNPDLSKYSCGWSCVTKEEALELEHFLKEMGVTYPISFMTEEEFINLFSESE